MVSTRGHDPVASLALAAVAASAVAAAWLLPWWTMEARAPQYGQRTLVVEVNPRRVTGDVFEVDTLGHYVGIRRMDTLAGVERKAAPVGLAVAMLGLLAAPWLRRRWARAIAVLPAIAVPLFFVVDLRYWMNRATNERDPDAALNLTITAIDTKLFGEYEIAQFKVTAKVGGGLYVAGLAGLLGMGLIFAAPLPPPIGRKRRKEALGVAAATAILLIPGAGSAAEHEVSPGSLAKALEQAAPGDTLRLARGVHAGNFVIDRTLHLTGAEGAILDGGGTGTVLRVAAKDVELRGLTIRASGDSHTSEDAAVRLDRANGAHLDGVHIEDTLFGVFVFESDDCAISNSAIAGKRLAHERRGDAIRLWHSSRCRLIDNKIENSRDVVIWYSSDTHVEGNVVTKSRYGLHYMYSDRNVFRRNRFEDNQVGAAIMYSRGIELTENAFSYSNGPSAYGLLVKDADDVFIRDNRFVHNDGALFLDNAPQAADGRVEVTRNVIARNRIGVSVLPLTRRARFLANSFIGNDRHVAVLGTGSADRNVWSDDGRGNYWSGAMTWDPDEDGVSEVPVRFENLYEVLGDKYPVLAFFDHTPAARAIDSAARLFPIFSPRPYLTDEHPLTKPVLSGWTATRERDAKGFGLAAVGGALLLAGGFGALAAKRGARV